jgi:hypothetical protein
MPTPASTRVPKPTAQAIAELSFFAMMLRSYLKRVFDAIYEFSYAF